MPYLIILLISMLNGVFAMAEMAFISSKKMRLENLAKAGNWRAKMAFRLANDPHKFLPTVQMGMTALTIISGAYGGTEVADHLSKDLERLHLFGKYTEAIGLILTVFISSFLTLVIGELVPKTIGISRPEEIAMVLAPVMSLLYYVTLPFIRLLSVSTKLILRLLRVRKKDEPPITEDELKHLIEQGRQYGILEKHESDMMRSIFRTADRNVSSIMTHRTDIIWIDVDATSETILKTIQQSVHTSFPVCKQSLDYVLGIIFIKDILVQLNTEDKWNIRTLIREPLYVPESMPALELIDNFRRSGKHVSLVLNEYGSLEGIVTLHDVVEAIFGDIPMTEQSRDEAVQRADGSWLIDGMMQTTRWNEVLHFHDLNDDDLGNYNTLGGFVMHHLGKIPKPGDHFEFQNHTFEVVDMDGMRVDKVLVKKNIPDSSPAEA